MSPSNKFACIANLLIPGLIYRMFKPKVVILIFASGKLVVTGGKEESDVFEAVDIVKKTLESKQLITYSE